MGKRREREMDGEEGGREMGPGRQLSVSYQSMRA